MEGIDLKVTGDKIDERCESLITEMVRAKFAVLEGGAVKLTPLAKLVQLCAEVLYGGEVEAAWPLVLERMRLNRQEQREVEQRLGLGSGK